MDSGSLRDNPFFILGVSPRSSVRDVASACETKGLELDTALAQKARAALTQPKARLAAELRWLIGLAPSRAHELVKRLESDASAVRDALPRLPALARCNLALELAGLGAVSCADALKLISQVYEGIDPEHLLGTINEDRTVAEMPRVQDAALIRQELSRRAEEIADSLAALLERESDADTQLATVLEEAAGGDDQLPLLLHLVTDRYHLWAKHLLDQRADRVREALQQLRTVASGASVPTEAVPMALMSLEHAVRAWDRAAQPLQLLARSKGTADEASITLAHEVRSTAVDISNEHGLHEEALAITNLIAEAFEEVPHVLERIDEDREALEEILSDLRLKDDIQTVRPAIDAVRQSIDALRSAVEGGGERTSIDGRRLLDLRKAVIAWNEAAAALKNDVRLRAAANKIAAGLGEDIRSLAIDLSNDHGRHQDAKFLVEFTLKQFPDIPALAAKLQKDRETISRLLEQKRKAAAEEARWRKEHSVDLLIGQDHLVMTPETIQFKTHTIETPRVDRVRYGVYKHYINGIRVRRAFTVWVGTPHQTLSIECVRLLESEQVVSERMQSIIAKLWGLVGARLTWQMLTSLSGGDTLTVGSVRLTRKGAWLTKRHWLKSEPFFSQWTDMRYWSAEGNLILGSASEPKATAQLSYRDVDNAHVLEHLLEFLWKDGNYAKLERGGFSDS